jgi:hypothetical protein
LPGGRQRELAARELLQDLLGGEAAQHPAQHARVGADLPGDLVRGARAIGEHIGDPQLGGDEQQLRRDVSVGEPGEPRVRRCAHGR